MSTELNEVKISAASAKGGPLQLPIHMEDLPPDVQRELQLMELEAQKTYWDAGLDPCLDFQAMISLPHLGDRIELLSRMIARERARLEGIAKTQHLKKSQAGEGDEDEDLQPRKGAWFSDDW